VTALITLSVQINYQKQARYYGKQKQVITFRDWGL